MKNKNTDLKKTLFISGLMILVTAVVIISGVCIKNYIKEQNNKSAKLVQISYAELSEKVANKDSFILVVSREGCSHCEDYEPIVKGVLEQYEIIAYKVDTATFTKEETAEFKDFASVSGTPTTLFITNGVEETTVNRLVGVVSKNTIIKRFKDLKYIEG